MERFQGPTQANTTPPSPNTTSNLTQHHLHPHPTPPPPSPNTTTLTQHHLHPHPTPPPPSPNTTSTLTQHHLHPPTLYIYTSTQAYLMREGPSAGLWEDLDVPISMATYSPSGPPSIGFFLFLLDRRLQG